MNYKLILLFLLTFLVIHSCIQKPIVQDSISLVAPDDLEVKLWAASPLFYNPTNIDIDAKGRVWVTEAVNYRNFNNDSTKGLHHSQGDRVMILEDKDEDGSADHSKIFVQDTDLVAPVGLAVIGNKVYVSCSPHLIVYTDENGDDQPDKKEIFLTGFGGHDHDHSLHAIVGGPDGHLYFNTGNAGPHMVTDRAGWTLRSGSQYTGGSPYNTINQGNQKSDDGKVWVGGLALKIKPDGTGLKVIGHNFRNSYELVIDSRGDVWQNDNDDQVVACRTSWLPEEGNAGFFSTDGTRSWQADQRPGQDIFDAHWHQEDPGVMPVGDRTGAGSPTGVTYYESDALGEQYRGMLLSAEAGRNTIFAYHPTRYQSGYNLGPRINFITSLNLDNERYVWNDTAANKDQNKWFRPSDVAVGTEGAIYIADWYDPVVGGHQMKDSTGFGRIYRVTSKGKQLKRPVLDLGSAHGQLQALMNPAINVRYAALNQILQSKSQDIPSIKKILSDANPYHRARAIWALAMMGPEGIHEVELLLAGDDLDTKIVAYRALRNAGVDMLPLAKKLLADTSIFIQRELINSISHLPYDIKKPLLLTSLRHFNGVDQWYLEALCRSVTDRESTFLKEAIGLYYADQGDVIQWDDRLEALVWRLHPVDQIDHLVTRITSSALTLPQRTRSLTALAFIKDRAAVAAMMKLSKHESDDISSLAIYWLAFRQNNEWHDLYDWSKWNRNPAFERKLAEQKVKLSKIMDAKLPYDEKKWNAQDLASDSIGGNIVLASIANNKFPKELYKEISHRLLTNKNLSIRVEASQYFKSDSTELNYNIPVIAAQKYDSDHGKQLFATKCSICHRLGGVGLDIGPNLQAIHNKFDRPGLLDALVNPSAGIVFGYEAWSITTTDGQSHVGFLIAENKQSITIKDLAGKNKSLALNSILTRKKYEKSLMPSAGDLRMTAQELADLSGYLLGSNK